MSDLGNAINKVVHEALDAAGIDQSSGGNLIVGRDVTVKSKNGEVRIAAKGLGIRITDDAVYLESQEGESRRLFVDGREIT